MAVVEKGLRPEGEPGIRRHLIDINATPEAESQQPLPKEKSMHYLSLVKPQMMQQALSLTGSREERKPISSSSDGHMKRSGEGQSMELFPLHPGFAATKSITSSEPPHRLQGRSLPAPSEIEGVQLPGLRSPSPATTQRKQSFSQLIIFYNGTVSAYEVPADKAQTIMNMLAGNGSACRSDPGSNIEECASYTGTSGSSSSPPIWKAAPTDGQNEVPMALSIAARTATANGIKETENLFGDEASHKIRFMGKIRASLENEKVYSFNSTFDGASDLPLARKQSLQRFLQKRQNRLTSVAPYTTNSPLPR